MNNKNYNMIISNLILSKKEPFAYDIRRSKKRNW